MGTEKDRKEAPLLSPVARYGKDGTSIKRRPEASKRISRWRDEPSLRGNCDGSNAERCRLRFLDIYRSID